MSRLAVAEIVDLLARAYGTVEDKRLARENKERDDKIRELQRQLEELKGKLR